jgi:hypothetical protein
MNLAAIYNVWDGVELLRYSINSVFEHVDRIIIIYQTTSNYGESYDPHSDIVKIVNELHGDKILVKQYFPIVSPPHLNEINKRNEGLQIAKELGCTHFLHMDCDEMYANFDRAKEEFLRSGHAGSVCRMLTYFKEPIWRFENEDNYYVPFIHKLEANTIAGVRDYPFYCDPTRRINQNNVKLLDTYMHHFSWVRANILRKVRNSTAKANIEVSQLVQDYNSPECGPGFYVKDFRQKLRLVDNLFNIDLSS